MTAGGRLDFLPVAPGLRPHWYVLAAGIAVVIAVGLGVAGFVYANATLARPRNVILISLDTLRADRLGVYGYSRDTSPALDRFAAESFVFERALAPAPNTPPSQMSMMTSLYPGRHGFTGNGDRLSPHFATLAERMQAAGFQTAGFVDGGYLNARFGFGRGFDVYDQTGGGFAQILPRAMRWLRSHGDSPFFLFLHTYDIHAPYASPPPFRDRFLEEPYQGSFVPTAANMLRAFKGEIELDDADLRFIESRYDEGIRYTDAQLGGFLRYLAGNGYLDATAVLITSDHGEEFHEHGSVLHWQLFYEPNLRVPLVVRPPGGMPQQVRVGAQAELIDVLPTVLDWVGAEALPAAQGRSLVASMARHRSGWQRALAGLRPAPTAFAWWSDPAVLPLRSAVGGGYQLIFDEKRAGADQLFDIEVDPLAQNDVAAEHTGVVERLRAEGLRAMARNRPPGDDTRQELDPEIREQLRALGYEH